MRSHECLARFMLLVATGLTLLAPDPVSAADFPFKLQAIVRAGDTIEGVQTREDGLFLVGTLNDNGQLVFVVDNAAGGRALIQYADGRLTPIVVGGRDAPVGMWLNNTNVLTPVSMNEQGDIAFSAGVSIGDQSSLGTFLWDFRRKKVTAVAVKGMPAAGDQTFEFGSYPVINQRGEMAFVAGVKNAAGAVVGGIFFRGRDGKLEPVILVGQELPGGRKIQDGFLHSLNDAGVIGFSARTAANGAFSGYVWQKGTITQVAAAGTAAPGGGTLGDCLNVLANNSDASVLVGQIIRVSGGLSYGLFRWAEGGLIRVVFSGQPTPEGGKLADMLDPISFANEAGEHAFLAPLADGTSAAYALEPDDTLSLIFKSGTITPLGKITQVGAGDITGRGASNGVTLNSRGQAAFTVKIDRGVDTLVLLTPARP